MGLAPRPVIPCIEVSAVCCSISLPKRMKPNPLLVPVSSKTTENRNNALVPFCLLHALYKLSASYAILSMKKKCYIIYFKYIYIVLWITYSSFLTLVGAVDSWRCIGERSDTSPLQHALG